jgi:hypothetical protein
MCADFAQTVLSLLYTTPISVCDPLRAMHLHNGQSSLAYFFFRRRFRLRLLSFLRMMKPCDEYPED